MKKPVLFGILWWIVVFFEVSIVGFTPGLATMGDYGFTLNATGVGIHFVLLVILTALLAKLYVRKSAIPPTFNDGLRIAAIMAAVGLILDAAITVPFFVKDYGHYYSKWTLWVGIVIFIAVFSAVVSHRSSAKAD